MKNWYGAKECDICHKEIHGRLFDGETRYSGVWATMCEECYSKNGSGDIGYGNCQIYEEGEDGTFYLVAGSDEIGSEMTEDEVANLVDEDEILDALGISHPTVDND